MNLTHTPLAGRFAALEPLEPRHREDLRAACDADPELWTIYSFAMHGPHFDSGWRQIMADARSGRWLPYAVMVEGRCIGMSSFITPDARHRTVEVGGTYYAPAHRGGPLNPQAKRLLMGHAFACGANRIAYRVDAVNARSRAAVLKLGATQEGVLRHDKITWTGRVRDTVQFSILKAEWPAVRDGLDARLAAFATP